MRDREKGTSSATTSGSAGVTPRDSDEISNGSNRRLSATQRETSTTGRATTPLRERPESRERGNINGTTNNNNNNNNNNATSTSSSRGSTPSRGIRTDGASGTRSSSPWLNNTATNSSIDRESGSGARGWKY